MTCELSTPEMKCVMDFIDGWNKGDMSAVIALLSDDIIYHNMPLEPISGKQMVSDYLCSAGPYSDVNWEIVSIAENGNKVLTERIDKFTSRGNAIELQVMGVFEITAMKITAWRDYFDLSSYRKQYE